MRMKKAR
jgi:hypothetical protein